MYKVEIMINPDNVFTYKHFKNYEDGTAIVMYYNTYDDLKSDMKEYINQLYSSVKSTNKEWLDLSNKLSLCFRNIIKLLNKNITFLVVLNFVVEGYFQFSVQEVFREHYGKGELEVPKSYNLLIESIDTLETLEGGFYD